MNAFAAPPSVLDSVLRKWEERFDDRLNLIRGVVGEVRYHTRIQSGSPVHQTRESTEFASALLECADPVRHARAAEILKVVLPLQDTNTESPSCGIWPWFYEEPLEKMAPPDWNWADFLGTQLAQTLWRNSGRLSPDMVVRVKESLRCAARSIMKRDVRLSYTNIAIMGAYVTIMTGKLLGDAEILAYGKNRLRKFVEFTRNYGGFPEYNSPAYYLVGLMDLGRMLRDFPDEEDRDLARETHDRIWEEIAMHWHGPSGQWAGPHSRSYSTLLKVETLAFLQQGLGERGTICGANISPSLDQCSLPVRCPDRLVPCFLETSPARRLSQPISEERPALQAHMHMEPGFVLSSAERAIFGNQNRGMIAYAPSENGPVALALRFLHDGYDFCSANLLARQEQNRVLAGICLAYDGGDVHGELDRYPDRRIQASDWRLRLEFFNEDLCEIPGDWSLGKGRVMRFGSVSWIGVSFLAGQFGDSVPRFETGSEANRSWIDLVFFHGEKRIFHFRDDFPAFAGLAVTIADTREQAAEAGCAQAKRSASGLDLSWINPRGKGLHLESPAFARSESEIKSWAREHLPR